MPQAPDAHEIGEPVPPVFRVRRSLDGWAAGSGSPSTAKMLTSRARGEAAEPDQLAHRQGVEIAALDEYLGARPGLMTSEASVRPTSDSSAVFIRPGIHSRSDSSARSRR